VADPNLIAAQREQIVRALDGNRPEPGFLSSLFGTTVAERGAHDVLKEMTLGEIKTDILNAPPAARAAFAAENNIDTASMTRWVNYLNQVSQADTTQDPSLKLDAYLDKIAEHLSKTPATPRA
jgi:hypothetical protein